MFVGTSQKVTRFVTDQTLVPSNHIGGSCLVRVTPEKKTPPKEEKTKTTTIDEEEEGGVG